MVSEIFIFIFFVIWFVYRGLIYIGLYIIRRLVSSIFYIIGFCSMVISYMRLWLMGLLFGMIFKWLIKYDWCNYLFLLFNLWYFMI